jgi:transcriptional regulator with XRE-family HTH domain
MIESYQQIKLARIYLNWTQSDLAKKSGLSLESIRKIEQNRGFSTASYATIFKIYNCFLKNEIVFINDDDLTGVAKKRHI